MIRRQTLSAAAELSGKGLFTSRPARLRLVPAAAGHGLRFSRTDLAGAPPIPAHVRHLAPDPALPGRNTTLRFDPSRPAGAQNPSVATVEHVLSALAGLAITDAMIEVDGPEIPIFDGSASVYVQTVLAAGRTPLDAAIEPIRVTDEIRVKDKRGALYGEIVAAPRGIPGMSVEYTLDYGPAATIPRQHVSFAVMPDDYVHHIAPARTFCLEEEARAMRSMGLFADLSPRDMLVLDAHGRAIDNTLRFPDEPARHKALDVIGDLALAGRPIFGAIRAERCGHALNHALARALSEL